MRAADFPGQVPVIVERGSVRANSAEGVVRLLRGALAMLERGNREAEECLRQRGEPLDAGGRLAVEELQVLADRIATDAALCDLVGSGRRSPYVHSAEDVNLPAWAASGPADEAEAFQFLWPVQSLLAAVAINRDAVTMLASSTGATRAAAIATLGELYWQADRWARP